MGLKYEFAILVGLGQIQESLKVAHRFDDVLRLDGNPASITTSINGSTRPIHSWNVAPEVELVILLASIDVQLSF
jgi:hypothetical protein